MTTLWQLRKLSTNENLSEPQPLPENWGPIFGLHGFVEKLNDLSWVGVEDQGWFDTGVQVSSPSTQDAAGLAWSRAKTYLEQTDWTMLPDVPMTKEKKTQWVEYRRILREIRTQDGFPNNISWPNQPE